MPRQQDEDDFRAWMAEQLAPPPERPAIIGGDEEDDLSELQRTGKRVAERQAGGGFFMPALTALDRALFRPARAISQAGIEAMGLLGGEAVTEKGVTGRLAQAATSFLPRSLSEPLGLPESETSTFGEFFQEAGFGAGPKIPFLAPEGGVRTIAGFLADLATPMLPGTGAVLKAAGRGTKAVGEKTLAVTEKAAAAEIPVVSRGARSVLGAIESVSEPFKLRNFPQALAAKTEAAAQKELLDRLAFEESRTFAASIAKVGDAAAAEAARAYEQLGVREASLAARASKGLPATTGALPRDTLSALADLELTRLIRGKRNALALEEAKAQTTAAKLAIIEQAAQKKLEKMALSEKVPIEALIAEKATQAKFAELPAKFQAGREMYAAMSKEAQGLVDEWYHGTNAVFDKYGMSFGKVARESELVRSGPLDIERWAGFRNKHQIDQVTHSWNLPNTAEGAGQALVSELGSLMPHASGQPLEKMLGLARRGTIGQRQIAGTIDELARKFPDAIQTSMPVIALKEGRRVAATAPASEFLGKMAATYGKPPRIVSVGPIEMHAIADPGMSLVRLDDIPYWLKEHFTHVTKTVDQETGKVLTHKFPIQVPNEIAREIGQVTKKWIADPKGHSFMDGFRAMTDVLRGWLVVPWGPVSSSILRNATSNAFNNAMGLPAWHVKNYKPALDLLRGKRDAIKVGAGEFSRQEILREAIKGRVVNGGFVGTVVGDQFFNLAASEGSRAARIARRLYDPKLNPITKSGFWLNNAADNLARMTHFITRLQEGKSFQEAAESVGKWLYGGRALTEGERTIGTVAFPFYAWTRWNLPASIQQAAMKTRRFVALGRAMEAGDIPNELKPLWIQQQASVAVGKDEDGSPKVFLLGSWIPFAQLAELDSFEKFTRFVGRQLNPLIRTPIELSNFMDPDGKGPKSGWSVYFQRAISTFPGEQESIFGIPVNRKVAYAARAIRLANEIDRVFFEQPAQRVHEDLVQDLSIEQRILRFMGLKTYTISLKEGKKNLIRRYEREIRDFGTARKWRLRRGTAIDLENVRIIDEEIEKTRTRLRAARGWNPEDDLNFQSLDED